jgi:hypothetical protein
MIVDFLCLKKISSEFFHVDSALRVKPQQSKSPSDISNTWPCGQQFYASDLLVIIAKNRQLSITGHAQAKQNKKFIQKMRKRLTSKTKFK